MAHLGHAQSRPSNVIDAPAGCGEGSPIDEEITVRYGDAEWRLGTDDTLSFGRSQRCTICLDPDDVGVSRQAGVVQAVQGIWWVVNKSRSQTLSVIDDQGLRKVLAPGQRLPIDEPVWVVADGTNGSHRLRVLRATAEFGTDSGLMSGVETAIGARVSITADDRVAMVALFAEYLEDPPRSDPQPKSYRAAAARLGWPRSTLVKRIEYLRARLDKAGVPNMTGFNALAGLAEYALARRLITKEDLVKFRAGQG
ncbi:MAG TPA: hypothetical protein VF062_20280 [Candidatus Limnocylindrales bacterium]